MTLQLVTNPGSPFDAIRQTRADGTEWWSARDLMPLLGYDRWENFHQTIGRAKAAAENVSPGHVNFRDATKMVELAFGERPVLDYELTRFAAYLVAMNGDPRKPEIAAAQAYFATKTREAEVRETSSNLALAKLMLAELEEQQTRIARVEAAVAEVRGELAQASAGDWVTALGYARRHHLPTDTTAVNRLGKAAAKASAELGQRVLTQADQRWGSVNVYHVDALTIAAQRIGAR